MIEWEKRTYVYGSCYIHVRTHTHTHTHTHAQAHVQCRPMSYTRLQRDGLCADTTPVFLCCLQKISPAWGLVTWRHSEHAVSVRTFNCTVFSQTFQLMKKFMRAIGGGRRGGGGMSSWVYIQIMCDFIHTVLL